MPSVFVSYRRADAPAHAGRLYDALAARFGAEHVFKDLDSMEPGVDFVEAIEDAVGRCDVLIAVIGRDWLQGRLDDPHDWVRLEIARALERGIRVVPVRVQGASMPQPDELPGDLKALGRRHAVELSESTWTVQVNALIDALERESERAALVHEADLALGTSRDEQGDVEGARAAYQRVIDADHPEWSWQAKLKLAELLFLEDEDAAQALFQEVLHRGPEHYRARALCGAAAVFSVQGKPEEARQAYVRATAAGDDEFASCAWVGLGDLALDRRDLPAARAAFERALEIGHPKWLGHAADDLGMLLDAQGDAERARAVFQIAIDRAPDYMAQAAGCSLARLLAKQGDLPGARAEYQKVIASGEPTFGPVAAAELAELDAPG